MRWIVTPLSEHLYLAAQLNNQEAELSQKSKRVTELEHEVNDLCSRNMNLEDKVRKNDELMLNEQQ